MPKVTTDELRGYAMGILVPTGEGETVAVQLVFTAADGTHRVIVPLDENGKAHLVRALTGGIVISNGHLG